MLLGSPSRIRALATAPLRRLALSVLFTIATTSYQTTCTVSERSSIKGTCQCKPTRSSFSHYNKGHKLARVCVQNFCILDVKKFIIRVWVSKLPLTVHTSQAKSKGIISRSHHFPKCWGKKQTYNLNHDLMTAVSLSMFCFNQIRVEQKAPSVLQERII